MESYYDFSPIWSGASYASGTGFQRKATQQMILGGCMSLNGSTIHMVGKDFETISNFYFYSSTNGGASWRNLSLSSIEDNSPACWSLSGSGDAQHVVLGCYGFVLTSHDSGYTWLASYPESREDTRRYTYSVDIDDSGQYLAASIPYYNPSDPHTDTGRVYVSSDFGSTWSRKSVPAQYWHSVSINSDGSRLLASGAYALYTSSDYGESWMVKSTLPFPKPFRTAALSKSGSVIISTAALPQQGVQVSKDFGGTFQRVVIAASHESSGVYNGVAMDSSGTYMLVPYATSDVEHSLYSSSDGGLTWQPVTCFPLKGIIAVAMMSGDGSRSAALGGTVYSSPRLSRQPSHCAYLESTLSSTPTASPSSGIASPTSPLPLPTSRPSHDETSCPTMEPSALPTSLSPTRAPSSYPSQRPSRSPSTSPSSTSPTNFPVFNPTLAPTSHPTIKPTYPPSRSPSVLPTVVPSRQPSVVPSHPPSPSPSALPSLIPTRTPTRIPTTSTPSFTPSLSPTCPPTMDPTLYPTPEPSTLSPTTSSPTILRIDSSDLSVEDIAVIISVFFNGLFLGAGFVWCTMGCTHRLSQCWYSRGRTRGLLSIPATIGTAAGVSEAAGDEEEGLL